MKLVKTECVLLKVRKIQAVAFMFLKDKPFYPESGVCFLWTSFLLHYA